MKEVAVEVLITTAAADNPHVLHGPDTVRQEPATDFGSRGSGPETGRQEPATDFGSRGSGPDTVQRS
jgi:hypothetical protein